MVSELVVILDLIAGVLIGFDFFMPKRRLSDIQQWIIRRITPLATDVPLEKELLTVSFVITVAVALGFMVLTNIHAKEYPLVVIGVAVILWVLSIVVGIAYCLVIYRLMHSNYKRLCPSALRKRANDFLPTICMVIAVLPPTFILHTMLSRPNWNYPLLTMISVPIVLGSFLFASSITITSTIGQFIKLQNRFVLARIGLAIFVVSRVVQLYDLKI